MRLKPIAILLIYFIVIIVVAGLMPRQVNWQPQYGSEHKDPLGTFILFDQIHQLFTGEIIRSEQPIYNVLKNDSGTPTSYLFINDRYAPDRLDTDYLLQFVHSGGEAFISANTYSYPFMDTLGFLVQQRFNLPKPFFEADDSVLLSLINPQFHTDTCYLQDMLEGSYVSEIDSIHIHDYLILGKTGLGNINFIKRQFGAGSIYLHCAPAVFSNFGLLHQRTANYVSAVLGYLSFDDLIFDDYYKSGNSVEDSPLSVLFRYPALSWAWNILVIGTILFMIFGARRLARAIPVLKPYENESLRWIETVGAMHYNHRDNLLIAKKRIRSFQKYINSRYALRAEDWHDADATYFSEQTGIDRKMWEKLLNGLHGLTHSASWDAGRLRRFSQAIDDITNVTKNK